MGKLRVFTAFSGYDSQCMALDKLGIKYDLVGWSEIDKYAIKAHNAVSPQLANRNFGDISKIDWEKVGDFDLFTYSFPCQDISNAGNQKGLEEGSGTRSSLLWECPKAIEAKMPKYLVMENVSALVQRKFLPYFEKWQNYLSSLGYVNYTKILNSLDYGIPQNRKRVFMVSVLNESGFSFPEPFKLQVKLNDILEKSVDESFYVDSSSYEEVKGLGNNIIIPYDDYNRKIPVRTDIIGTIIPQFSSKATRNGYKLIEYYSNDYKVRRLTPKECFRLMGVNDDNIMKIQNCDISEHQQFKLAGNSIVVDVLYYIFRKMFAY